MYVLGRTSISRLKGVHPDLVRVVKRAIKLTSQDFSVLEGVRSVERQRELVNKGASQTMNSRHITGHAVDLVPYPVAWDWPLFYPIADAMIEACTIEDVPLRWGGNWQDHDLRGYRRSARTLNEAYRGSFPDGPHFELSREHY